MMQLESIYRSATVVANICIYAAPDKAKPIAIIVPAEPALKKLAADNNIEGNHLEDLVHNEKLQSIILRDMQAAGKSGGLAGIEIIDGVVLADEEWNPHNVGAPWLL
jgi:long-chain acyl-CoA synthetase